MITSEPVGASVYVNGASYGVTPSALSMPMGEHRIEVGDGDARRARTVKVTSGGEAVVHLELPRGLPRASAQTLTGELQISTDPAGAQVSVDGRSRGVTPVSVPNLSAGAHTVSVSGPRGVVTRRVMVQQGTVSSLVISMTASAEFASGWLAISSPIPLQIREGANVLGNTTTPKILVSAGRHDLELTNAALGYRVRRTVQVTPGGTSSLKLEVPNGMVHINALPWAEVWIGTRNLGETPIANVSLPLGNHELLFRHPELGEQRRTIVVGAGDPVRVGVDLRKGAQ